MARIEVRAEVTGKVWKIESEIGARVEEEGTIMIIESMKMEIPVMAQVAGTLKEINVKEGDDLSEGQVVAVLFSKSAFSPPRNSYVMRPVTVQVDKGRAMEERWRYFGQTVTAVDMKNERSLTTLVGEMEKGTELHLRVNPESASSYEITFPIQGAHEALGRVYESCGDTYPVEVPAA